MEIRVAEPADEAAVVQMCVALWPHSNPEDHRGNVRATLSGTPFGSLPAVVFIAVIDGRPVGFVEVDLRSHVDGCDPAHPTGFLEAWYVAPAFQRRGIGRALVDRAQAWAAEQGCTEFGSDTLIDNELGQRAHAALGFEVVDRCVNYRKSLVR